MCVIAIYEKARPSYDQLKKMHNANNHGGGIAWFDNKDVAWTKGLNLKRMYKMTQKVALPFVVHFRIATSGGRKESLCHPFEINKSGDNRLSGTTRNSVLFHNGILPAWSVLLTMTARHYGIAAPAGSWSDSRALAWAMSVCGDSLIDEFTENGFNKFVVMNKGAIKTYGAGWGPGRDGALCSNLMFEHTYEYPPLSRFCGISDRPTGIATPARIWDEDDFGRFMPDEEDFLRKGVFRYSRCY